MILRWQKVKFTLKETFVIAHGNYTFREALIITLEKNGVKGYGECTSIDYYHINLSDFDRILHSIQSKIESRKIEQPAIFYEFLTQLNIPSFLRSALDCAYWDLFGKLEKRSFLELNAIDCAYLPESSITISVDTVEKQIQKINESSWNRFKVKCNHFKENDILKLVELPKNIALDSNGSYTKTDCLWLENFEKSSKFMYLEQPMEKGEKNFKSLRVGTSSNWMADEDCQDINDLQILKHHYKSINIKLVKCGGLTPALQMISKAKELGFQIMIGCMTESSVGISAGAVLAPLCDFADLDGATLLAKDIAKGSQVFNGKIQLSEDFGLGIRII